METHSLSGDAEGVDEERSRSQVLRESFYKNLKPQRHKSRRNFDTVVKVVSLDSHEGAYITDVQERREPDDVAADMVSEMSVVTFRVPSFDSLSRPVFLAKMASSETCEAFHAQKSL